MTTENKDSVKFMRERVTVSKDIDVYLGDIELAHEYTDLLHKFNTANESDTFHMHINSHGGYIYSGVQLINAMQNSLGKVITYIESSAISMGALIFMAGDEKVVYNDTQLMFHNYSGGFAGKSHEIRTAVEAEDIRFVTLLRRLCSGFLTEKEIVGIIAGDDLWLTADQVNSRFSNNKVKKSNGRCT